MECPSCSGMNKPGAKPMIILEQDGTYFCLYCGHTFRLPPR